MDELEAIKVTFFQECEELLADLEGGLLAMEEGAGDLETVNAVFRAVHSIKGGAGAFGLEPLVRFAHVFETLLDAVRAGSVPNTVELAAVLLRASDILADHVSAARGLGDVDMAAPAALAADICELYEPLCEDNGLDFKAEFTKGLAIRANREFMAQALANLMDNAIAYGGGCRVGLAAEDGHARITIDDDGPGIPPRLADRLFEPFVSGGGADGTGLGLTISRELAANHGGALTLLDTGPQGTRFELLLPL